MPINVGSPPPPPPKAAGSSPSPPPPPPKTGGKPPPPPMSPEPAADAEKAPDIRDMPWDNRGRRHDPSAKAAKTVEEHLQKL
eukprot:1041589-Amphidinium_carterae.1